MNVKYYLFCVILICFSLISNKVKAFFHVYQLFIAVLLWSTCLSLCPVIYGIVCLFWICRNYICYIFVTWCVANILLTCLFTYLCWLLISRSFNRVITLFVLFLHNCFSQEEYAGIQFTVSEWLPYPLLDSIRWDESGVDSVYFTHFFFQSRSLSLEALKSYRLLLITFTCSEGILLHVKPPSVSKRFFYSWKSVRNYEKESLPSWWCGKMELSNLPSKPSSNPSPLC